MHDIVDLEARGVPGVFVASTEFVEAAEAQRPRSASRPWPGSSSPHPIQDRTDDEMRAYADAAFDEILASSPGLTDGVRLSQWARGRGAYHRRHEDGSWRRSRRGLTGAAVRLGGDYGQARRPPRGRASLLIGDSVMAAFNFGSSAQATISSPPTPMQLDAVVCRRLVDARLQATRARPGDGAAGAAGRRGHLGDRAS